MATVKAFSALRFTDKAGDISKNVCPPYDIISEEQRLALLEKNENNLIRLELPRGEEPYKTAAGIFAYQSLPFPSTSQGEMVPRSFSFSFPFSVTKTIARRFPPE